MYMMGIVFRFMSFNLFTLLTVKEKVNVGNDQEKAPLP